MTEASSPADAPFTIVIPASNESRWIEPCLDALLAQTPGAGQMAVIVSANACRDDTAARALSRSEAFAARGSSLSVIDSQLPGKPGALNRAEALAPPGPRAFLDADVTCTPGLIESLRATLRAPRPLFATGRLVVSSPRSSVTRRYARLWQRLPFLTEGATGAGLFAVNPAGRARWKAFPDVISDDTFARLHFAPDERIEVPDTYLWPLPEGFRNLARVRRRQDDGIAELRRIAPHLFVNDATPRLTAARLATLATTRPLDLATYLAVRLAARIGPRSGGWTRGR